MSGTNPILTYGEHERLATLRTHLEARANYQADNNLIDWEAAAWMELIDKMAAALDVVQHSFKPVQPTISGKPRYFLAECLNCGWWGTSGLLTGGGAIADTGDHYECRCPMCCSDQVDGKPNAVNEWNLELPNEYLDQLKNLVRDANKMPPPLI